MFFYQHCHSRMSIKSHLFVHSLQRQPHGFEVGMKIEIVDRRNPILIRVATVLDIEAHRFLVHFDGWSNVYDYWVDDDCPDIHPPGWCSKTGHPLTTPIC